MGVIDWDSYPNFSKEEFDCRHTGDNEMDARFMERLQQIRGAYNKPMIISSGYRASSHPVEAKKNKPGAHALGLAADISVDGEDAMLLISVAYLYGFRRIGVNQKGLGRFIHLDLADRYAGFPKAIWSY